VQVVPPLAVEGTMRQERLPATAPRPVDRDDLAGISRRSMEPW
jgi:hydroxyacid-oxoacid transhydrogenase